MALKKEEQKEENLIKKQEKYFDLIEEEKDL